MTAHLDSGTADKLARHLDRHPDDLAIIADWKDELIARIDRAQMYLELVGLDHAEQDDLLADEVQTFRQVCLAIVATKTPAVASRGAA